MAAPGKPAAPGNPPPPGVARPPDANRGTGTFAIPKRAPVVIPGRSPTAAVRVTPERPASGAGANSRNDLDPVALAHVRTQRIERMTRRAISPHLEQTLSTAKALRGMLEVRMRGGEVALPVLPAVAAKLNAELALPNADLHRVADIISSDVAVAAKVLQVANSATFRGSSPINTVSGAVVRLGMRTSSSIVMSVCQKSLYQATPPILNQIMEDLFAHALASAIFARGLALLVKYRAPEEAFLAALLHDVASPLILRMVSEILRANRNFAVGEPEFVALAKELHTEIGVTLLKKWEFTGELLYTAEHHDHLTQGHAYSLLNNITFMANVLANRCGFALVEATDMEALEAEGIQALGITTQQIEVLKASVIDSAEREIAILSGI